MSQSLQDIPSLIANIIYVLVAFVSYEYSDVEN